MMRLSRRPAAVATLLGAAFVGACGESSEGSSSGATVNAIVTGPQHAIEVANVSSAALRRVARLTPPDSAWLRVLAVYVEADDDTSNAQRPPAIIGRHRVVGEVIRFEPRFPFAPGVRYRVEVDSALGAAPLTHRFTVPAVQRNRTTRVVAVHPAAPRLPSNLLRLYIELSAPMEAGNALAHVRLLDESGREVPGAFLALDQELWDPDRRRLTLLLDPGRVKRGVRTNVESGTALVAGRRYRIVIDSDWADGAGAPLASGFEHAFEAVDADRRSPDPARWRLTIPRGGRGEALRVAFGEALDHALASHMLTVQQVGGPVVPGTAALAAGDSAWSFTPLAAWIPGEYVLRVNSALEDVAGNSVARVFDADRAGGGIAAETAAARGPQREVRFRVSAPTPALGGPRPPPRGVRG